MVDNLNELVKNGLGSIKGMVDVSTVVGEAIVTPDGTMIIPVTQVSCGFGAGGTDLATSKLSPSGQYPFGGGSGGGVKVKPVAFLVVAGEKVKLIPVSPEGNHPIDKLVDMLPEAFEKVNNYFKKKKQDKSE
ncbi:MAG: GerW family sporulation protein [Monoglobales bacterium]